MYNVFVGSIIFAIWAVILFFGKSIGLSMLLFSIPITYFLIYILEKNNKILNKKGKVYIIPIILLSCTYFIFDNVFFNILNIFVIPLLIIFMIFELTGKQINLNFKLIKEIVKMVVAPFNIFGEAYQKSRQALKERSKKEKNSEKNGKTKKIVKAFFITLPLILFIIFLLGTADATFGEFFKQILITIQIIISQIQLPVILMQLICAIIIFIYLLGFFYYLLQKYEKDGNEVVTKNKDSFTIKWLLSCLNVVYLIFCIIQIKALFVGDASINYSEYARQGFFQLMIVSLINLVMILIAKRRDYKNKYTIIMCIIMIVFTFIILISSAYRMYLYEAKYGYTLLRLLAYCILFTEAILLVPTILYILNKKQNLIKSYLRIVIIIYVGINFINVDNIIASRNIERYKNTGKIDLVYLAEEMGTDATAQLMRIVSFKDNSQIDKYVIRNHMTMTYQRLNQEQMDFRDFNISKIMAKKLIEEKIK